MKILAGLNPDPSRPGFSHVSIHPQVVGGLSSARGSMIQSEAGLSASGIWKMASLLFTFQFRPTVSATVSLPTGDATKIFEGTQVLAADRGPKFLQVKDGCAEVAIGSGDYNFHVGR